MRCGGCDMVFLETIGYGTVVREQGQQMDVGSRPAKKMWVKNGKIMVSIKKRSSEKQDDR